MGDNPKVNWVKFSTLSSGGLLQSSKGMYHILLSIVRTFYIENDAEIFFVHYGRFKISFMMNKLIMINSREIILEK